MTTRAELIASPQVICSPLFVKFVLSQKEAEENSAKTVKASPVRRVDPRLAYLHVK